MILYARASKSGQIERGAAGCLANPTPWWKEPTKDQWLAFGAAWMGWTLDAFDFTMFLLIMVPISQEFHVPLTEVAFVLSVTLWLRLVGAVGSGWLADRVGRKIPLMISILWYSLSNFAAGFSPTFAYLFLFRALLGIGMGAEWPAGSALAMETWPVRSRGFMGGLLQGSWGLGFMLSSAIYGLFYSYIGWRGMLWVGVLPALSVFYVRKFVKEPPVWLENRRRQRAEQREVRAPLISIFKSGVLANTLTACVWMAGGFVAYYSVNALFATHLQKDLNLSPGLVATPIFFANLGLFLSSCGWGWWADRTLAGAGRSSFQRSSHCRSRHFIYCLQTSCGSRSALSPRACAPAAACRAKWRPTSMSASQPRCGPPLAPSVTTRPRCSAASCR